MIPAALSTDLSSPMEIGQCLYAAAFGDEAVPAGAAGPDDGARAAEQAAGEVAVAQILLDTLDRVELGRVGWQADENDIRGQAQLA